jgi:hypothetical protein
MEVLADLEVEVVEVLQHLVQVVLLRRGKVILAVLAVVQVITEVVVGEVPVPQALLAPLLEMEVMVFTVQSRVRQCHTLVVVVVDHALLLHILLELVELGGVAMELRIHR